MAFIHRSLVLKHWRRWCPIVSSVEHLQTKLLFWRCFIQFILLHIGVYLRIQMLQQRKLQHQRERHYILTVVCYSSHSNHLLVEGVDWSWLVVQYQNRCGRVMRNVFEPEQLNRELKFIFFCFKTIFRFG